MVVHDSPAIAEDAESRPRKRAKIEEQSSDVTMLPATIAPLLAPNPTTDPSTKPSRTLIPPASANMASAQQIHNSAVHDQASKETACGITEFVCPDLLGFTGILKKRYTDFLVNEILPSGQVVHLDNTQAPKKKKEANNGSKPSGPSRPAPAAPQEIAQNADTPMKEEPDSTPSGAKIDADTTISRPSSPKMKPEEEVSVDATTNAATSVDSSSISAMPISMQSFDSSPTKPENLAPHMRIAPPSSPVPLSMRDLDDARPTPKPTRKRETVRIRRTSQGWMEVDEQKEKELNGAKAAEDATVDQSTEESAVRAGDAVRDKKLEDAAMQETPNHGPEISEETKDPLPPITQASWQAFAGTTSADAEANTRLKLSSEDMTALLSYFGSQVVNELLALHERIVDSPHRKAKEYGTVKSAVIDRQTRSKIHQDLRRMFDSRLETVTDSDGHMIITALPEKPTFYGRTPTDNDHHKKDRNNGRGRNDRGRGGRAGNNNRDSNPRQSRQSQWAELGGDYLHFSLCKENKDTMEAISWLVKQLNMKPSAFQFAGTKDRRGVTVQRVSVYRVFADRMVQVGRSLRGAKIGNFEYQSRGLQLGELKGNEFTITLRDCDFHYPYPADSETLVESAKAVVGDAIKHLGENGFINYYGLQRFGTFSTSTDQVGVKMLQGDFESAVEGILHFELATLAEAQDPMAAPVDKISREDQARAYAINLFKTTGEPYPALNDLPRKFSTEANVIRHLGKQTCKNDYFNAIQTISRNMRLMYVHAYQSLVWNMAASHRWKRFGATVLEGDLVLINEHRDKLEPEIEAEKIDADGEVIVHPSEDDRAIDPEDKFTRARALTKEEAESGKYTIFDVVLPTPGYDILYPANELTTFYEEFMRSERGGGLDPHDMRRKWKDISLSGSYRKLLARPSKDFSFDIRVYKNEDEQFVETDLDRLEKARADRVNAQNSRSAPIRDDPAKVEAKHDDTTNSAIDSEHGLKPKDSPSDHEPGGVSLSGGPYRDYKIAVILKLQFGSSQYATMALRELMKHGGARAYKADFSGGH